MAADLFEEHRQLVAAAEALLMIARREPPARADQITQLRMHLSNLAKTHLRSEDELIIAPLITSGRAGELPEAQRIMEEIRNGQRIYSDHVRRWTLPAVEADRAGYATALVDMIDYLRKMIEREEAYLYWPALRLLSADRCTG
ncbi:hemerythrin domain-containing protein [Sphingobium nicotianae]|uniref:Hemerythrin domain-containing protein n=1 Tax=Sphingobium nicotianae TaxID=2782607 RepID=A0A9X1DD24_9SPHN|nr:hemerythrin domain-containing protein [Sphingobium nicotianae]MBT2187922.1 hemerythrin domain-containing protein [Sphingobium nicotianae]